MRVGLDDGVAVEVTVGLDDGVAVEVTVGLDDGVAVEVTVGLDDGVAVPCGDESWDGPDPSHAARARLPRRRIVRRGSRLKGRGGRAPRQRLIVVAPSRMPAVPPGAEP
jgi:hypothetical protein